MITLHASAWLNTPEPVDLAALRGKVVVMHAFQMLCPGCVSHGIPQTQRIREIFPDEEVAVIGLHTVFEHHDVMTPRALEAFIHEYRLNFPVAVDEPMAGHPVPRTMQHYALKGTPSLLMFDHEGRLRLNHFGRLDDMIVGRLIGQLMSEPQPDAATASTAAPASGTAAGQATGCENGVCVPR
jgi:peroxiredoxin